VCNFSNIEFNADVKVIEEIFTLLNEEVDRGIKQPEISGDTAFPDTSSEPEKLSYFCTRLSLETFYHFPGIMVLF